MIELKSSEEICEFHMHLVKAFCVLPWLRWRFTAIYVLPAELFNADRRGYIPHADYIFVYVVQPLLKALFTNADG